MYSVHYIRICTVYTNVTSNYKFDKKLDSHFVLLFFMY